MITMLEESVRYWLMKAPWMRRVLAGSVINHRPWCECTICKVAIVNVPLPEFEIGAGQVMATASTPI